VHNVLSGRVNKMSENHIKRIDKELILGKKPINSKEFIYIPCFSLNTLMKALEIKTIDYFSLDVEGGEVDVLKSIDFENLNITSFSIEHNGSMEEKDKMVEILAKNKYSVAKLDAQDIYFLKNL
jgi:hypothetical protein